MVKRLASALVLFASLPLGSSWAASHRDLAVPEVLRPWVPWVLQSDEALAARCPMLAGQEDETACLWPARLELKVDGRGGAFSQEWQIYNHGLVGLPGGDEHWPLDVKVDGRPARVMDRDDGPMLWLEPGRHRVSGRFAWDSLPESLDIPKETGLVTLVTAGRRVAFPLRDGEGRLFLGKKAAEASEESEADSVDISVHRKLTDDVPLLLTTRLVLAVSGKNRELTLGRSLPVDFEPMSVEGELPLRFERDNRLRIQARPGSWTITIVARRVQAQKTITRPVPDGLWKEGEEVWVFEARPDLRVVNLEGATVIDPAQTTLPGEWRGFPAYALAPGATLSLAEQRRGDAQPAPDRLNLARQLWLDFDGQGMSVQDDITGQFTRAWRLEMDAETQLGRVTVNGQDQFITRLGPNGLEGVELRAGQVTIETQSRVERAGPSFPAVGFAHDFESVSARLHVPPGWQLAHASGVDKVGNTWISRWTLMDLFILLLVALATGRLYGWWAGALAGLTLGLTLVEFDAPRTIWLWVIFVEALLRALREGRLLFGVRLARLGVWVALLIIAVPFAMQQARRGMHPGLEGEGAKMEVQRRQSLYALKRDAAFGRDADEPGFIGAVSAHKDGTVHRYTMDELAPGEMAKNQAASAGSLRAKARKATSAQNLAQYDPATVVQTGQGVPRWDAQDLAELHFSGPVSRGQTLHLYLLPPWLNSLLAFARVLLLAGLTWLLLRRPLRLLGGWLERRPLLAGLLLLLLLPAPALAKDGDGPSPELLTELKTRLLEVPACTPDCVAINDLILEATPGELRLRLKISAAAKTGVALPGGASSWTPTEVRVDGKPALALRREDKGDLWLALEPGVFTVELLGPLPNRDSVQIPLPQVPRHASGKARGFSIDGIHEDGAVDESIVLNREESAVAEKSTGESREESATPVLPPFLRVERTLALGLKWEAHTRVLRQTPEGSPVTVEIPLLAGESVTTPGIRVERERAAVSLSFGPTDKEIEWQSTLAQAPVLKLRADPTQANRWSETWRLQLGPTWHASFAGIPPVHAGAITAAREPEWRPWPGEEVVITLDKPKGVGGQTLTVDSSQLEIVPGLRSSQMTLTLELRSSRGTLHRLGLPEGALVESLLRDNTNQPLRQEGNQLVLDVLPGRHFFKVALRQSAGLSLLFRAPQVDLGLPSTNCRVTIDLQAAPRWLLWLAGPRLGPRVHVWSALVVLALLGWALARSRLTPLRTHDWILLGLGLLQLGLPEALLLPVALLALGKRSQQSEPGRAWLYDLGQLALLVLLIVAGVTLVAAVEKGLLQTPEMQVMGNGSGPNQLNWYLDRIGGVLPRPAVLSLPMFAYRAAMLAWALWLALACVRWARWIWATFKQHGLWQPLHFRLRKSDK